MQIDRLSDHGLHIVYAVMTEEFLTFGKQAGNDLSTPSAACEFPGLLPYRNIRNAQFQ